MKTNHVLDTVNNERGNILVICTNPRHKQRQG